MTTLRKLANLALWTVSALAFSMVTAAVIVHVLNGGGL